jgi:fatty acid desaturase/ferredoxin
MIVADRDALDPRLVPPAIAVPTVLVWFGSLALWLAATAVVLSDLGPWWLLATIPAHVLVTYAMFTVLHEAIHYAVGRPKWLNELFGRLSVPFVGLWVTYPVIRFIHIEHHRNTNEDPRTDPDAWSHAGPGWQLPLRWLTIDAWYSRFCLPRMLGRPRKDLVGLLINETLLVALVGALIVLGYGWDFVLIYLIPQRLGLGILAWWFDWLPHHDLGVSGKTDTIRASRVRVGWERLMNPLLLYQNYHVVHHVHPRIPFYLWMKAWQKSEADYLDRGVPISTAWGRELTPSEYAEWRGISLREGRQEGSHIDDAAVTLSTVVVRRGAVTEQTTSVGDESLLEAALRAGVDAPYSCIGGGCGACEAKLLLGDVHMERCDGLSEDKVAQRWILTCRSRPATDVVHIEYEP